MSVNKKTLRGRPRRFQEKPVFFAMKLTSEEKEKIFSLSKILGTPASHAVILAVEDALKHHSVSSPTQTWLTKHYSVKELQTLPKREQTRILKEQARILMEDFELIPDGFDILDEDSL